MSTNLRDVVSDWGGFEEFVKEIHEGEDVVVQRDVTLKSTNETPSLIFVSDIKST